MYLHGVVVLHVKCHVVAVFRWSLPVSYANFSASFLVDAFRKSLPPDKCLAISIVKSLF